MEQRPEMPARRLWAAVFPKRKQAPRLDEGRVKDILGTLSKRQRRVLHLRFGFEGKRWSLSEVAAVLPRAEGQIGVTRERVWQLEKEALRQLRRPRLRKAWREAQIHE